MVSQNRFTSPRDAAGSGQLDETGGERPSCDSGPDDGTSTPKSLHEEAVDYCLLCARYTIDPEKPDQCIHWETCEDRQERFPSMTYNDTLGDRPIAATW